MPIFARSSIALALSILFPTPVTHAATRDATCDVAFHATPARAAITQLGESLGKSVVFDVDFRDTRIDFDVRDVTRAEAFARLLRQVHLFSVDVAGVVVVAPDTRVARNNYSAERVAACAVAVPGTQRVDPTFHNMRVGMILESVARSLGYTSLIAPGPASARSYSFAMADVTRAETIQVVCLATHHTVRVDGTRLVFSPAPAVVVTGT